MQTDIIGDVVKRSEIMRKSSKNNKKLSNSEVNNKAPKTKK